MKIMLRFICENWLDILLVVVGLSALLTYILQERKKKIDAASLIVLQIDELQERIREFSSYIVEGQINSSAFYESLPLMGENYWNKYKHYFVKKMDHKSFSDINLFYSYVSEIQEQQLFLKQIQKDGFSTIQKVLSDIETQLIGWGMNNQYAILSPQNFDLDMQQFWTYYNQRRQKLETIINQNAVTSYMPIQIRISLEKKFREYSMLNVSGSFGYQMLCKYSKKQF